MYRRDIPTWGTEVTWVIITFHFGFFFFFFYQSLLKCLEYTRITGSKQCELTALCGENQEPVNMGFIVFKPMEISSIHNSIDKYKIAIIISTK